MKNLNHFKIPDLNLGMGKNIRKFNKGKQLEIIDFLPDEYQCAISGELFENKISHDLICIYKYCKGEWIFK